MDRFAALLATLVSAPLAAANIDGSLDPGYGTAGRNIMGYLESDALELRAISRSPTDRVWMFADDRTDSAAIYLARVLANGQPDTGFGSGFNGRQRTVLPPNLVPGQPPGVSVDGAFVQSDGKPVVFGGLYSPEGFSGQFPALLCRYTSAGNLDIGFSGDGCLTLRSFFSDTESCRVTDAEQGPAGHIVVIGNCTGPSLPSRPFLARVAGNGTLDLEYGGGAGLLTPQLPGALANGQYFEALALRADGTTLVLAQAARVAGLIENREIAVAQFDGGGSLDAGFASSGVRFIGFDLGGDNADFPRDLAVRNDGRVLVLGQADAVAPARTVALYAQLTAAGALDPTFGIAGRRTDDFNGSLGTATQLRDLELDDRDRAVVGGMRSAFSSTPSTAGTDFWLAIPRSVPPHADGHYSISADVATSGILESPALAQPIPFTVVPGRATTIAVPFGAELDIGNGYQVSNRTIHVRSQLPITLQIVTGGPFKRDGTLVLPTPAIGTSYRVNSWGEGLGEGSQVGIAATQDQTVVTIVPSVPTPLGPPGVPYQVSLSQGQSYKLVTTEDLTATTIVSNKPLAVFAGHSCGLVGGFDFCEGLIEQQIPVDRWGTNFIAALFAGRSAGDVIRVLAHQNDTVVSINGVQAAVLPAGSFYQANLDAAVRISSNLPVSVNQYAKGCKAEADPCRGDANMLGLTPIDRWVHRYNAPIPPLSNAHTYYLQIIAPTSAIGSVLVDGNPLQENQFMPVGTSGFSRAELVTSPGLHRVAAAAPIGVWVHSFQASEAQAYQAAAAPGGEGFDTDDLLARYTPAGATDALFGQGGHLVIDHREGFETPLPSRDSLQGLLVQRDAIVVGTGSINAASEQSVLLNYRVAATAIFSDGFE